MTMRRLGVLLCVACSLSAMCAYMYLLSEFDATRLLISYHNRNGTFTRYIPVLYTIKRPIQRVVQHYTTAINSKTKPPFYPLNGTGQTVNITADFDTSRFQEFCTMETNLEAVIPVYSAPDNFQRRKAMRETVGRICSQMRCKMFFIVGVSLNKETFNLVKEEYAALKDILMVDKVDTYRDLNNKVAAMLDFLITFCKEPKYVIHIIDDFYPNLKSILNQLHQINKTKFIMGRIYHNTSPFRNKNSQWYVSPEEYPNPTYPPYLVGVVYAFLNNDNLVLRQTLHAVEYCWVEDVWFTGHVRIGAGFEPIQLRGNYKDHGYASVKQLRTLWRTNAGFHQIIPSQFYEVYNNTEMFNKTVSSR